MLLRNYSYINSICGHVHSGVTNPQWILSPHSMRGYYGKANTDNMEYNKLDSFPTGTQPPYSYILADSRGLMTATTTLYQSNTFENLNLAGGLNGESTFDGSGDITASLGALAYLISTISNTSTLNGDIAGLVSISATLAQSGDLTGSLGALVSILADLNGDGDLTGDIAGALSAVATLAGEGDLTGAIQGAVQILSDITGSGELSAAIIGNWNMAVAISGTSTLTSDIEALANLISTLVQSGELTVTSGAVAGDMSSNITSFSELSPENLAAAVWNSLAASYNTSLTMGEKLNDAGSAGDPWSTILPGTYTGEQAGKIVSDMEDLIRKIKALTSANL